MKGKVQAKTKSSKRWLERQRSDYYVLQAKEAGYRSRAAYKLIEIQQRDKVFSKGMTVVDLGAAPGGWSQVASHYVGREGKVIATDILPIEPINGVDIVQGDFQQEEVLLELVSRLQGKKVALVISDMAPNLSGIVAVDQARSIELAEVAIEFVERVLEQNGSMLIKIFQGLGFQEYVTELKSRFNQVVIRKPKASRKESREVYLLAKGYQIGFSTRGECLERYA